MNHIKTYIQEFEKHASVMDYRPFSVADAMNKGAPVGAALGALAGGVYGLTEEPEYDPRTGRQKSRAMKALERALLGGAVGGVAGASMPTLSRLAMKGTGELEKLVGKGVSAIGAEEMGGRMQTRGGAKSVVSYNPLLSLVSLQNLVDSSTMGRDAKGAINKARQSAGV